MFNPLLCSIVHHTGIDQIDLCTNQLHGSYIIDKHCQIKAIITSSNFYLLANSAFTFNHLPVSLNFGFEAFCLWFIF